VIETLLIKQFTGDYETVGFRVVSYLESSRWDKMGSVIVFP